MSKFTGDQLIQKTCPQCQKQFEVLPCRKKRITCSKECRRERGFKRGAFKQERQCAACGEKFAPLNHKQPCCKTCVPTHSAGGRWRQFGLTQAAYEDMFAIQERKCRLCRISLDQLPTNQVHLDHDHLTNRVRGILCQRCNLLVGMIELSRDLLPTIMEYIDEF